MLKPLTRTMTKRRRAMVAPPPSTATKSSKPTATLCVFTVQLRGLGGLSEVELN
jgi:hypothetical protein